MKKIPVEVSNGFQTTLQDLARPERPDPPDERMEVRVSAGEILVTATVDDEVVGCVSISLSELFDAAVRRDQFVDVQEVEL
jgi:hypothetical protein